MVEILAAFISGAFDIAATFLGFVLGLAAGLLTWWWKARGIRHMLGDEIETNWIALRDWQNGPPERWPVRSVYIWQSLQTLVPGVLSRQRVKAVAHFYYRQAVLYRNRDDGRQLTPEEARALHELAGETLTTLGRKIPPAARSAPAAN